MLVREVMTDHARSIDSSELLADAAEVMRDSDVGMLPVFESGRLTGIVTDRDLVVRGIAEGKDPNLTTIREIMTPRTAFVFDDQDLAEAVRIMQENAVRRVPVLNRAKSLVGILSEVDLPKQDTSPGAQPEGSAQLEVPRSVSAPSDS
jgi:CBS domain-containing protein